MCNTTPLPVVILKPVSYYNTSKYARSIRYPEERTSFTQRTTYDSCGRYDYEHGVTDDGFGRTTTGGERFHDTRSMNYDSPPPTTTTTQPNGRTLLFYNIISYEVDEMGVPLDK